MGAKSRTKGANGERQVVNYATALGLSAQRQIRTATTRNPDPGDVHIRTDAALIVCQVKAGKQAQDASETLLGHWWGETLDQAVEAGGDVALLVCQRRGVGMARPQEWVAICHLHDLVWLVDGGVDTSNLPHLTVRLPLGSLLTRITTGGDL